MKWQRRHGLGESVYGLQAIMSKEIICFNPSFLNNLSGR